MRILWLREDDSAFRLEDGPWLDFDCVVACTPYERWEAEGLLEAIARADATLPVVLLLADFTYAKALRLRQIGAFEALPIDTPEAQIREIACIASLKRTQPARSRATVEKPWRRKIAGECQAIERLVEAISLIAERRSTVLITGETGTGKEVIARVLHEASGRRGSLVTLNCAALPEALLEAELFGHTKGAFTGAQAARVGRFEAAQHGTIFLDEIGDMPFDLQAKLLRVLQEREVQRLGSSETIAVDVRVIAATNVDLMSKVEDGRFREDLFFRLNVVPIHLPPLRERGADLPILARHFVRKICGFEGLAEKTLGPAVLMRLGEHHWPGNVRELENTIERAIALSGGREELTPADLMLPLKMRARGTKLGDEAAITVSEDGVNFERIVAGIERSMIEQALRRTNGNKSQAAELLNLKRTTLGAKMRTLGAMREMESLSA